MPTTKTPTKRRSSKKKSTDTTKLVDEMEMIKQYPVRFLSYVSQTITFETGGRKDGAYTETPGDKGGATKWGISLKSFPGLNIKALTYKDAVDIYFKHYYSPLYDFIVDEPIAFKLFDMGVLTGPRTATKLLQKAVIDSGYTIKADGLFGPITLTAINVSNFYKKNLYELFLKRLQGHMKYLVFKNPTNYKFLKGWLIRVNLLYKPKEEINGDKK